MEMSSQHCNKVHTEIKSKSQNTAKDIRLASAYELYMTPHPAPPEPILMPMRKNAEEPQLSVSRQARLLRFVGSSVEGCSWASKNK